MYLVIDKMDLGEFYGKGDVNLHLSQVDRYLTAPKVISFKYYTAIASYMTLVFYSAKFGLTNE